MTATSDEDADTLKSSELRRPATARTAPEASSTTGTEAFSTMVNFASENMSLSFLQPFIPKGRILSEARHCLNLNGKEIFPASRYSFPSAKSPIQAEGRTSRHTREE